MASARRMLREVHRDLRRRAADPEAWIYSPVGTDLWMDGLATFRCVDEKLFDAYLKAFLELLDRTGSRPLEAGALAAVLAKFDLFLKALAAHDPRSFRPALAVGLSLVQAMGGPPRIETGGELAILNDSLLFLLSPIYRGLRLSAYNAGLRTLARRTGKRPVFRPEYGHFRIQPPNLIDAEPPRIPYYNYSHDLAHIVLFGDAYLRPVGTPATTASLLLNAEETVCTLDLVHVTELTRFGVELHAVDTLKTIEAGPKQGRPSVTERVAQDAEEVNAYQAALKASAQSHLSTSTAAAERIVDSVEIPEDLSDWFHPLSQRNHASWSEKLGRRVWHPVFQRFVSLLPPDAGHAANVVRFCRETFTPGEWIGGTIPEPDPEARAEGIVKHRLRFLVIRAAEVAVQLSDEGNAPEALLEDLTRWALGVVDDLVRAEPGRVEEREQAVRDLLVRHGVPDAQRLGARFDDPVAAPA